MRFQLGGAGVSALGVVLEVHRVATQSREGGGRPKFRYELGGWGSDLDKSWICRCIGIALVLHWFCTRVLVQWCCASAALVLVQDQCGTSVVPEQYQCASASAVPV